MPSVVWVSEPLRDSLVKPLDAHDLEPIVQATRADFLEAAKQKDAIAFVDNTTVEQVPTNATVPLVLISDSPVRGAIGAFQSHAWLCHVIGKPMLDHAYAAQHLRNVVTAVRAGDRRRMLDWLPPTMSGRRIRLTHASRRAARLERMTDFFETNRLGTRAIELLRDAAEELLTNAFYNAPVAAGVLRGPVSRTQDIALPDDSACDLVYGCQDDLAVVRVRDPFGSLSRRRLIEVLTRCATADQSVTVDETMGGAGLGMWRVFSGSMFVAVSVVKNHHTEIIVGVGKKTSPNARPFAHHLFFSEGTKRRFWKLASDETSKPTVNKSVMIVAKSKE